MEATELVKYCRITLDADSSMQRHVANLFCISYYHLWELQRVRRYLTHETAVKVANAMVGSCMDYCNSLLYHTKRILVDVKEFKTFYVALCENLANSAM